MLESLGTKNPEIMCRVLKQIMALVIHGEMVGEAFVPYYRQILPVMNIFKNKRRLKF